MELLMAKAKAGHDSGEYYVVLGEDGGDFILVNGKNRSLETPKRKRKKHVQLVKHFSKEIAEVAGSLTKWTDEAARKLIYMVQKEESGVV